jgi:hypothetical protein
MLVGWSGGASSPGLERNTCWESAGMNSFDDKIISTLLSRTPYVIIHLLLLLLLSLLCLVFFRFIFATSHRGRMGPLKAKLSTAIL